MPVESEDQKNEEQITTDDLLREAVVKRVRGKNLSPGTIQATIVTGKNLLTMLTVCKINPADKEALELAGGYISLLEFAGQRPVAEAAIQLMQKRQIRAKPPK